jgi:hypothetical protein
MRRWLLSALLAVTATIGAVLVAPTSHTARAVASVTFTYEVRGLHNRSSLDVFAALAAQTYADPRGWSLGGSVTFRRVTSGGNYTLWLAAAADVPSFGSPCDSTYSCRIGRNVVVNEDRWLGATPAWLGGGRSLRDYRNLVVNHETGHWLGFGHAFCGGAGQLAPVMQQQSISLQGCRPNDWPLPSERQRLATKLGVPILTGAPVGTLDLIDAGVNRLGIHGWAIDPDTHGAVSVHIHVDGRSYAVTANGNRPGVATLYPGWGAAHGYSLAITVPFGTHTVCAYALGCRTVLSLVPPSAAIGPVVV